MAVLVAVGVERGHDVDVDAVEEAALRVVAGELLDGVERGRRGYPLARVDARVDEQRRLGPGAPGAVLAPARQPHAQQLAALEALAQAEQARHLAVAAHHLLQELLDLKKTGSIFFGE